ncbi:MAG: FAD binding domain-containing protein, partial [Sciscionella sp.]
MQVPAQFQYDKASTVQEALDLITRYGAEARFIAGGHSLIPMMKLRLAQPDALIDINDLDELSRISIEGDRLRIGAMVRHADLLGSAVVAEHFPIFADAERVIADPVVRNRGTIGGSLCQADPSEDLSAVFSATGAGARILGAEGERIVDIRDFFVGPYQTAVADGELLLEFAVPIRSTGSSYQ